MLRFEDDGGAEGSEQDWRVSLWTRPWSETKPSLVVSGGMAKFDGTGKRLVVYQGGRMAVATAPDFEPRPLAIRGINWSACPGSDVICILTVSSNVGERRAHAAPPLRLVLYDIVSDKEVAQLQLARRTRIPCRALNGGCVDGHVSKESFEQALLIHGPNSLA